MNNYIIIVNILNKKVEMLEVVGDELDFCFLFKLKVVCVKRNIVLFVIEYD